MRRIAAERCECWNIFALGEAPFPEIVNSIRLQNRAVDEACIEVSRDPATLRRSLVCWKPLDPWETRHSFERIVLAFKEVGIGEIHVMRPPEDKLRLLERAAELIPSLR